MLKIRNLAAQNVFKENVVDKVDKRATTHKQKKIRMRAILALKEADAESKQHRWYCKVSERKRASLFEDENTRDESARNGYRHNGYIHY